MSFGVIISTRTSPPSGGGTVDTGTVFLAGPAAADSTQPTECHSLDDLVGAGFARTGAVIPSYDWIDGHFRQGGGHVYFAGFSSTHAAALAVLDDPKLGPGQLAVLDTPSTGLYSAMQSHCINNNRVAIRDVAQDDTVAEMITKAAMAPSGDDYGATFAPWYTIPAPAGVLGGTSRVIPASAAISALCNQVDLNGNPNRAAAGDDYPLWSVLDFTDVSDSDRAALFSAGVNHFGNIYGTFENYGFQTNIAETPDNPYWQFNCSRARMFLQAVSKRRAQPFMFQPIDGRGRLEGKLKGVLESVCKALYDVDGLYGDTPQDAYNINVSAAINPDSSIAQGQLVAVATVRWSVATRAVEIALITVPITGSVS
jgi:hypothetical protein